MDVVAVALGAAVWLAAAWRIGRGGGVPPALALVLGLAAGLLRGRRH